MAPQIDWDLRVVDDIAVAAAELFWAEQPRSVALSGGSTPRALYQRLAAHPERHPWSETHVFFGDERCVPPSHPDSNYRMARETLLAQVPATVHPMPGESCDAEGYEAQLREFFGGRPPGFDLTWLGMGEDGHTASLFPGSAALAETDRWVARTQGPDHARLTLTLPVLSGSQLAVVLISGAAKRARLISVLAGEDAPIARVRAGRVVVFADRAAAP